MTRLEAIGLLALIGMLSSLLQEPTQPAKTAPQVARATTRTWGQQSGPAGWFESTLPRVHEWFFPRLETRSVAIDNLL